MTSEHQPACPPLLCNEWAVWTIRNMQWGSREEGRRKVGQCHAWACPTGRRSTISKVVPQIHCKDDRDILGKNSSCELIIRSFLESLLCMFFISTTCSRSLGVYKYLFQEGRIKDVGPIEGVAYSEVSHCLSNIWRN